MFSKSFHRIWYQILGHLAKIGEDFKKLESLLGERKKLMEERSKLRKGLLYVFDKHTRHAIDRLDVRIRDKEHTAQSVVDDVQLEWREIKHLYGPKSMVFAADLLQFFPDMAVTVWTGVDYLLEIGLILALLTVGPFFAAGLFFVESLRLIPFVLVVGVCFAIIKFAIQIPATVLEYDPQPLDFFAIVGILELISFVLLKFVLKLLRI